MQKIVKQTMFVWLQGEPILIKVQPLRIPTLDDITLDISDQLRLPKGKEG